VACGYLAGTLGLDLSVQRSWRHRPSSGPGRPLSDPALLDARAILGLEPRLVRLSVAVVELRANVAVARGGEVGRRTINQSSILAR
jgi:hypothetical protein